MSEPQTLLDAPKWGDSLDLLGDKRKAELAQCLWTWKPEMASEENPGPFAGMRINGLEVFWLAVCALAGVNGDTGAAELSIRKAIQDTSLWTLSSEWWTPRPRFPSLYLQEAILSGANLQKADLRRVQLQGAKLHEAQLQQANLSDAQLQEADLRFVHLERAFLAGARLERADLRGALLQEAVLYLSELQKSQLTGAKLEGVVLDHAILAQADLQGASFDKASVLTGAVLTDVRLDGVIFDNVNLSEVDWSLVPRLQDERLAHQSAYPEDYSDERLRGKYKSSFDRRDEYQAAARAYRRLVVALQANGMSEEAAGYAYRAQVMQRRVYRFSDWRSWGRWLFSGFLDLLAGYGYKPGRSLVAYLLVIFGFAAIFLGLGQAVGPSLSPLGALVFSITSFHGRGFFPGGIALDDPITVTAAAEAIIGLLIEISFIATFTQRFFNTR